MSRNVDPNWQEFSASSREGQLYVKMPLTKAQFLIFFLEQALEKQPEGPHGSYLRTSVLEFLRLELQKASAAEQKSLFYSVLIPEAAQDAEHLRTLEPADSSGMLAAFRATLEAGLNADPLVDWISRVGGPGSSTGPQVFPTEAVEIDLDDVLDFSNLFPVSE